jgi:hypothetical protein
MVPIPHLRFDGTAAETAPFEFERRVRPVRWGIE